MIGIRRRCSEEPQRSLAPEYSNVPRPTIRRGENERVDDLNECCVPNKANGPANTVSTAAAPAVTGRIAGAMVLAAARAPSGVTRRAVQTDTAYRRISARVRLVSALFNYTQAVVRREQSHTSNTNGGPILVHQ